MRIPYIKRDSQEFWNALEKTQPLAQHVDVVKRLEGEVAVPEETFHRTAASAPGVLCITPPHPTLPPSSRRAEYGGQRTVVLLGLMGSWMSFLVKSENDAMEA